MTVLSSMNMSRLLDSRDQYYQEGDKNLMRGVTHSLKATKIKRPNTQVTLHLYGSHNSNNPDQIALELQNQCGMGKEVYNSIEVTVSAETITEIGAEEEAMEVTVMLVHIADKGSTLKCLLQYLENPRVTTNGTQAQLTILETSMGYSKEGKVYKGSECNKYNECIRQQHHVDQRTMTVIIDNLPNITLDTYLPEEKCTFGEYIMDSKDSREGNLGLSITQQVTHANIKYNGMQAILQIYGDEQHKEWIIQFARNQIIAIIAKAIDH